MVVKAAATTSRVLPMAEHFRGTGMCSLDRVQDVGTTNAGGSMTS